MDKHSKEVAAHGSGELRDSVRKSIGFTPALAAQIRLFPGRSIKRQTVEYVSGNRRIRVIGAQIGELPSGKIPRLILLWITGEIQRDSEDVDAATRTIFAGSSFRGFMSRLGIAVNGQSQERVREQLKRFATTTLDFQETLARVGERGGRFSIADAWQLEFAANSVQDDSLLPNFITLSQGMWDQLKDFPVPVDLDMIARLGKSALALDVYMWATYRVNMLKQPVHLTWRQLYDQFNAGETADIKKFRERFRGAVNTVTSVYTDLHIDASSSKRVVLYPSVPSVLTREMKGKSKPPRVTASEEPPEGRGDAWFTVSSPDGRQGEVFGSLRAFTVIQARQHLAGVVPLDGECPVCAYDARNRVGHGRPGTGADDGPVDVPLFDDGEAV